jgi:hypothetical protein
MKNSRNINDQIVKLIGCVMCIITLSSCSNKIPEECFGLYSMEPTQTNSGPSTVQVYFKIHMGMTNPVLYTENSWVGNQIEPHYYLEGFELIDCDEKEEGVYVIKFSEGSEGSYVQEITVDVNSNSLRTTKASGDLEYLELTRTSSDILSESKDWKYNPLWWQY